MHLMNIQEYLFRVHGRECEKMARIPEEFIENLIDKVDIVDVVSDYVSLKKNGSKYVGLCPFHNEKTPSFTVDGQKQLFYCFGCHVGGNIIGFLEKKENLSYIETIQELAKRANVPMPEFSFDASASGASKEMRNKIFAANKDAARYYFNMLFEPEGAEGLQYFTQRGLTENIIKRFGLGYAADKRDGLIKHLMQKGYDEQTLIDAGLARKNDYGIRDNFRTRVMFPIIAPSGEILGFGGRVLDHSLPKYLNTGDTPVFNKRKNLYALNILKKNNKGKAIIGEGYMDVIALNMAGFDYGVASLGTAVTPEQVRLLKRYASDIYICYDGDKAGISATHKVIDLMHQEKMKPKIISLPNGVDPDEYIKAYGAEAFSDMMRKAKTSIEYLCQEVKLECDMKTEEGRAEFAQRATAIVGKYAYDSIETEMYLKRIHSLSGFSVDSLYNSMGKVPEKKSSSDYDANIMKRFDSATERALIALLCEHPEFIEYTKRNLSEECFVSNAYLRIYKYLLEKQKKCSVNEVMLDFEGDEEALTALSAVGIETVVFGEPSAFVKDCCIKMTMDKLKKQRDELKHELETPGEPTEKIALAGKIAAIDSEIKKLSQKF